MARTDDRGLSPGRQVSHRRTRPDGREPAALTRSRGFFVDRGHVRCPRRASIPHDPTVLFTDRRDEQFKPYFLGEEPAPCARGRRPSRSASAHDDIELIGTTSRHCTFFEMLGNFSFGDYFKERRSRYAWELVTEVLGLDPDRLWVTVHDDRRRRRGDLADDDRPARRADPADGRGQLLGDGRDRAVRTVLGDLLRPGRRLRRRRRARRTAATSATSRSGTSSSCSSNRLTDGIARRPAEARTSTPARASSASLAAAHGVRLDLRDRPVRADPRERPSAHRRPLRRRRRRPTSRSASSPTTAGR